MRYLLRVACLSLCLQGCGGDTSVAIYLNWGSCDFDRLRWAQADHVGRGCMLASFLDRYPPYRMSVAELTLLLGEPAGYAYYTEGPAYPVVPSGAGRERTEHLLAFPIDRRTGRIVEAQLRPLRHQGRGSPTFMLPLPETGPRSP